MGYNRQYLVLIFTFLVIGLTPLAFAQAPPPPPIPDPCQGNPTPEAITVISAEVIDSNSVRLNFEQSLCSTEFDIERSDNGGAFVRILNIDRDFNLEFITRIPPNNSVFFFLDTSTIPEDQYDYRILAKTVVNEAPAFSPVVSVTMPPVGTSRNMISTGFLVQSNTITPIPIDYIEGSTPQQNLLFDLDSWIWEILYPDLVSMFVQWVFAFHGADLWVSNSDPQDQAQLFFIPPTPSPSFNEFCQEELQIYFRNDQALGQSINYTVTLLDYPTIIHQEVFTSVMANRDHVNNFFLTEVEEALILDYTNIYVQINAQGEAGLSPPNDRSLIIHDMIFTVPENQGAC